MKPRTRADFESDGQSWAARAAHGELGAVLSPRGGARRNLYLHELSLYAARRALERVPRGGVVLDFGCGTGRLMRYFAAQGRAVIGTEITAEMIEQAHRFGLPAGSRIHLTDGIAIPEPDASVDLIWVSGVLKYSLFPPGARCRGGGPGHGEGRFVPVCREIAREMHRVLKPGGWVVNNEVYVDAPPQAFTADFEAAGFETHDVRVLQRYYEPLARTLQSSWMPLGCVRAAARLHAARRWRFDDPYRSADGLRDFMFVWAKR